MILRNFCKLVSCLVLTILVPVSFASAQLAVTGIGVDPLKGEQYSCVRFTNNSQNNIEVKKQNNGQSRNITLKKGRRSIQKSIKKAVRRRKNLRKSLKDVNKKLRKLSAKLIITPKNQEKIEKLKQRKEKIEVSLSTIAAQIATLKETKKGIAACAKDEVATSGLQIVSGIVTDSGGRAIFFVGAYFPLENWDPDLKAVCARVNNGPVQGFTVHHPNSCLRTDPYDTKRCLAPASGYFGGRHYVVAAGQSGIQEPGTCPDPTMCSLSEATASVLGRIKGVKYQITGSAQTVSDCV